MKERKSKKLGFDEEILYNLTFLNMEVLQPH